MPGKRIIIVIRNVFKVCLKSSRDGGPMRSNFLKYEMVMSDPYFPIDEEGDVPSLCRGCRRPPCVPSFSRSLSLPCALRRDVRDDRYPETYSDRAGEEEVVHRFCVVFA